VSDIEVAGIKGKMLCKKFVSRSSCRMWRIPVVRSSHKRGAIAVADTG